MPDTEVLQDQVQTEPSAQVEAPESQQSIPEVVVKPDVPVQQDNGRMIPRERFDVIYGQRKKLGEDYDNLQREHAALQARAREYEQQASRPRAPQPQERDEIDQLISELQSGGKVPSDMQPVLKKLEAYEARQKQMEQNFAAQQAVSFYDKHIPIATRNAPGVSEDELRQYIYGLPVNHPHAQDPYAAAEEMARFKESIGSQYVKSADRSKLSALLGEMGLTLADVAAAQAATTTPSAPSSQASGYQAPQRPTGGSPSGGQRSQPTTDVNTREGRLAAITRILSGK